MSDINAGAPSAVAGWNVRVIFGSIGLTYAIATLGYLNLYGNPANSLHVSAQSWSYLLILAILGGFGVSTVVEPLISFMKK